VFQHITTVTYESTKRYAHSSMKHYSYYRIDSVPAISTPTHLK